MDRQRADPNALHAFYLTEVPLYPEECKGRTEPEPEPFAIPVAAVTVNEKMDRGQQLASLQPPKPCYTNDIEKGGAPYPVLGANLRQPG